MSEIFSKSTTVQLIVIFVMLVTNTATPGNGYLGRQNQAKTAASSGAQIESANVSDPSFKEYRGVGFIQPDQQRPGPSYYHDAKDS